MALVQRVRAAPALFPISRTAGSTSCSMRAKQRIVSSCPMVPSFVQTPRMPGRTTLRTSRNFLTTVSGLPTITRLLSTTFSQPAEYNAAVEGVRPERIAPVLIDNALGPFARVIARRSHEVSRQRYATDTGIPNQKALADLIRFFVRVLGHERGRDSQSFVGPAHSPPAWRPRYKSRSGPESPWGSVSR